jgi:phosphomannomutase
VEQEGLTFDSIDGVKVTLPDGWVHVRASNTQSIIRIIVEAKEKGKAADLLDWARDRVRR